MAHQPAAAMATVHLPSPERFVNAETSCQLSAWKKWSAYFKRFATAAGYNNLEPADQISHLLIHAGQYISDLYDSHVAPTIKATDGYQEALKSIETHFSSQLNASQSRFEFFNERQGSRTLDKFIQDIKDKATECDFCGPCSTSLSSTVFINGVNDRKLRRHLISIHKLDQPNDLLLKAIAFTATRMIEARISDRAATAGTEDSESAVSAHQLSARARHGQGFTRQRAQPGSFASSKARKAICKHGCFSHPNGRCRAQTAKCFKCQRKGHFSNVCRSVNAVEDGLQSEQDCSDEEDVDHIRLASLNIHELEGVRRTNDESNTWWQDIFVADLPSPVDFKLDSGAECNILPLRIFNRIPSRPSLTPTEVKVVSYSSHRMRVEGTCALPVKVRGKEAKRNAKFYVIDTRAPPLLGLPECKALNLIRRVEALSHPIKTPKQETARHIVDEFPDVFDGKLGCLDAVQKISIPEPPSPKKFPPRRIPMRFKSAVREQIKKMVDTGVLEPTTRTTRYVLPVVTVLKPDRSVRLCIDPRYINPHIQRMKFSLPKAEQLFANLGGAKFFTVVDADSAFYQLPLDDDSSNLCTISTEFGNFRFRRLPFGIVDASERFCEVMHRLFSDLDNVINCVDDFLIYGRSEQEHDVNLRAFLTRCRMVGLKLKPGKLQYAKSSVRFLGHTVTEHGVEILKERSEAIQQIKPPTSPTELRRFLGIINYLHKFIPEAATRTAPLRALSTVDPENFRWSQEHQAAFDELKATLSKAPVLKHIDYNAPLTISADSSSFGMGATLLQIGKPIAFASASLTPTQQRYAQLEKELLAVVFACEQFRFYILGTTVSIESDHRPLESIVKKDISNLSPRLQKMMLRLLRFSFNLRYVPGKYMYIADALSRSPMGSHFETREMEDSREQVLCAVVLSSDRRIRLTRSSRSDPAISAVCRLTVDGWPAHKQQVPAEARQYWQYRWELHVQDGLLYRGNRLVIPKSDIPSVISTLHSAHQGQERMLRQARGSVFWPGMSHDIRQTVENCTQCQLYQRANRKEPLRPSPPSPYPWHTVGADFMHLRHRTFIVMVDYFSKDVYVKRLQLTTAAAVITAMKELIIQHGVPARIISDNGPPFGSVEFIEFCREWDIELRPISPGHSQGNGQIERTIQTIKATLSKALDSGTCTTEALLTLRTTPAEDGVSPSQLANGRILRTKLPIHQKALGTEQAPLWDRRKRLIEERARVAQENFDRTTAELPALVCNQKVLVRKSCRVWENGVVIKVLDNPRSYMIRLSTGRIIRRNRIDIRPDKRQSAPAQQQPSAETPRQPAITLRPALRNASAPQANLNAQLAPAPAVANQQNRTQRQPSRSGRIPIPNSRFFNKNYTN